MIDALRSFNTDRGDIEDLVALHAFGKMVLAEFGDLDVEVPDWLGPKVKAIKREVMQRNSDKQQQKLAEINMRLESLKTPTEKKAELMREKKRLEQQLESVQ